MRLLIIIIFWILIQACTHNGPVHVYPGEPRPVTQLAALTMPADIDLVSLNDKDINLPHTADKTRTHYLLPGHYVVGLRYEKLWMDDDNNHEVVDSPIVGIEIDLNPGDKLVLDTNMPVSLPEARDFAKSMQLVFNNENNTAIKTHILPKAKQNPRLLDTLLNDKGTPYENLRSWWQAADDKEKAMFREYIKENP